MRSIESQRHQCSKTCSLNRYIIGQRFDLYGPVPIEIPDPELYVIYSGEKKISKDRITLSEEYFGGKKIAFDVEVKVLQYTGTQNIVDQYISFCKIFDQQIKLYSDDPEKGVRETIRICTDKKILEKYLQGRKEEVAKIMLTLFDQEYATKMMLNRERKEARQEGIAEGRQEGKQEGILLGQIDSIKQLMQNLSLSEEEAMNALGIPEEEREKLQERLKS